MHQALRRFVVAPVGMGDLEHAEARAEGENPICGDRLRIELARDPEGGLILGFRATACPACLAVASCAVEALSGSKSLSGPPFEPLRARVAALGGLSTFEGHAMVLVEEVLARALSGLGSG